MKHLTTEQQLHRAEKNRQRRERRLNPPRDPRIIALIENVRLLKENLNWETIYRIVLSGSSVYRQGIGLTHNEVIDAIQEGLGEKNEKKSLTGNGDCRIVTTLDGHTLD